MPVHSAPPAGDPTPTSMEGIPIVWKVIAMIVGTLIVIGLLNAVIAEEPKHYDLSSLKFGQRQVITIKAHTVVRVTLPLDSHCPLWTSDIIKVYDTKGTKRKLCGLCVVEGPQFEKNAGLIHFIFKNEDDHSITLKIGCCKPEEACTIDFNKN